MVPRSVCLSLSGLFHGARYPPGWTRTCSHRMNQFRGSGLTRCPGGPSLWHWESRVWGGFGVLCRTVSLVFVCSPGYSGQCGERAWPRGSRGWGPWAWSLPAWEWGTRVSTLPSKCDTSTGGSGQSAGPQGPGRCPVIVGCDSHQETHLPLTPVSSIVQLPTCVRGSQSGWAGGVMVWTGSVLENEGCFIALAPQNTQKHDALDGVASWTLQTQSFHVC